MIPQEIIRKKRNKETLSAEDITSFIKGISDGSVADIQVAALTMAIFLNGLNSQETTALTLAMRNSGDILTWEGFDKPIVDKHSRIAKKKDLAGLEEQPLYIGRRENV